MGKEEPQGSDILGIKPIGDAINTVTKAAVDAAAVFLGRICLPAAEEFGLFLQDKVWNWRRNNIVKIIQKAERMLSQDSDQYAHPRIVYEIIERGSWIDDNEVQEMWAGLLSSSCTKEGKDEINLIFIHILSQLTTTEVKIINLICKESYRIEKSQSMILLYNSDYYPPVDFGESAVKIETIGKKIKEIKTEILHLTTIGLIESRNYHLEDSGFRNVVNVKATDICQHMYRRCQGKSG